MSPTSRRHWLRSSGVAVGLSVMPRQAVVAKLMADRQVIAFIGDVLVAKAWNVQRRSNIGIERPTAPPAQLDYDHWVGPAEFVPFQKNRFHYHWHWWHNFWGRGHR